MPGEPRGHTRTYFHHLVRMPYMLADLGRVFHPTLNIIDGLIGQAGMEWGDGKENGPPVEADTLIAGDHTIATDACGAHLMGHDPTSDWLAPPFHRDRNALKVAAEGGFGTVDLDEIDFESEVEAPVGEFYARLTDSMETVHSTRVSPISINTAPGAVLTYPGVILTGRNCDVSRPSCRSIEVFQFFSGY